MANDIKSASVLQNDLKVFCGKKSEINELVSSKRIVANKWYLAWNTGEIFVATPNSKLIQYGGTANNLSKEDIEKIIQDYTVEDITNLKTQISTLYANFTRYRQDFSNLSNTVSLRLKELDEQLTDVINTKVNDVLTQATDITYSKDQIDLKIKTAISNSESRAAEQYATIASLKSYSTKEYADNVGSDKMVWTTGNSIAGAVAAKKTGSYFCTTNSTSNKYKKGHFYFLSNGVVEDLTPEGGSASTGTTASLSLFIDGATYKAITIGDSFIGTKTASFKYSGTDEIDGTLSLYTPDSSSPIVSISPITKQATFVADLTDLQAGTYNYTLSGITTKGTAISGQFRLTVIAPVYCGSYGQNKPTGVYVKSNFKPYATENIAGSYTITVNSEEYIWICVPQGKIIQKTTLNGFLAPFTSDTKLLPITFNNVTNTYNCYRSVSALSAGTYTIDIS